MPTPSPTRTSNLNGRQDACLSRRSAVELDNGSLTIGERHAAIMWILSLVAFRILCLASRISYLVSCLDMKHLASRTSHLASRVLLLASRISFLVSRFLLLASGISDLVSRFLLLAPRMSHLVPRLSFLASRISHLSCVSVSVCEAVRVNRRRSCLHVCICLYKSKA